MVDRYPSSHVQLHLPTFQGAYLHTRPPTPIHTEQNVQEFANTLATTLGRVLFKQEIRRRRYGNVADEWPPGRTPPEVLDKHKAEMKALMAFLEAPTPSDCSDEESEHERRKSQRIAERADHQRPLSSPSNTTFEAMSVRGKLWPDYAANKDQYKRNWVRLRRSARLHRDTG
ncbi:hypothetical protein F4810DRAFT_711350 [Camillea tinctor]|nr:hypothetical protein F4810DRAFT_711350 [Camillea tinctor]